VEAAGIPFDSRRTIAVTGDVWAPLFVAARDEEACSYQTQPLCERIACERAGYGGEIRNCTPPSLAFRKSFDDAWVRDVEIRGFEAGARFSNGREIVFVFPPGRRGWLIHRLRDRDDKFFE
jgi:hypothetical protein